MGHSRPLISRAVAGHSRTQAPQSVQGFPVGRMPSGVNCIAPFGQASTQLWQPMQRLFLYSFCGSGLQLSGLWHQTQRNGQPFRNKVVRMPGPSWIA